MVIFAQIIYADNPEFTLRTIVAIQARLPTHTTFIDIDGLARTFGAAVAGHQTS